MTEGVGYQMSKYLSRLDCHEAHAGNYDQKRWRKRPELGQNTVAVRSLTGDKRNETISDGDA